METVGNGKRFKSRQIHMQAHETTPKTSCRLCYQWVQFVCGCTNSRATFNWCHKKRTQKSRKHCTNVARPSCASPQMEICTVTTFILVTTFIMVTHTVYLSPAGPTQTLIGLSFGWLCSAWTYHMPDPRSQYGDRSSNLCRSLSNQACGAHFYRFPRKRKRKRFFCDKLNSRNPLCTWSKSMTL